MLRFMPEWWNRLMVWMDTTTIPLWVMVVAFVVTILYLIVIAWRDLHDALRDPPPYD